MDELSKVVKQISLPSEIIIILTTFRQGPRFANLPSEPQIHLRELHPNIYFHIDSLRKERRKLAEARLDLRGRITKKERENWSYKTSR